MIALETSSRVRTSNRWQFHGDLMAKRKARNPGKNKRKVKTEKVQHGPSEFAGYELGQEVWVRLDIYGGTEYGFGAISAFHPKDKTEPSFSFFDKIKKRFTVGPVANIVDKPPKKWMAKAR